MDSGPEQSGHAYAGPSAGELAELRSANRVRRVVAIVTLVGGVLFLYGSWDLSMGTLERPGPGLMPRIVAFGLLASAALALLERVEPGTDVEPRPDRAGGRRQSLVLVALTAYVAVIPVFGFLVSSALVMSVIAWILNEASSVKRALIIGITVAIVVDLTFRLLLGVNLPGGLWDIGTA